jgi:protein phosphatase 1 regulatory subunit 7
LGKNKIKKLENLNLPNLDILSIQSNRIIKIENLEYLVNLTQLYISDNGLTKIEGLEKLTKLNVLDLSNNKIERLENIENLKELEEFWFNNNMLSKWEDIDLLKQLPKLKCLYLEHNPIYYANNVKPSTLTEMSGTDSINSGYRRKIIITLPNLEQLDATLCARPK